MNKLKLFGWGYVLDWCISLFKKEQEERAVQIYIAECLRIITENTAKMSMGEGMYIKGSLQDILNPKPADNRTADEIIADIREKMGR